MALHTEVNFQQYVDRMDTASQKLTISDYVRSGTVLDYGCGSGVLAQAFSPDVYLGYDLAPEMVSTAKLANSEYQFTSHLDNTAKFDNIIFSSLLHEVYSYNDYSYDEVITVLEQALGMLSDNGQIIIRDGIQPDDNQFNSFSLKNPQDAQAFLKHLQENSPLDFPLMIEDGKLEGTMQAIRNFLNVYTWGWGSVEREQNERVNFATLSQWENMLTAAGYKITQEVPVIQEEYFEHLNNLINLNNQKWVTKIFITAEKRHA